MTRRILLILTVLLVCGWCERKADAADMLRLVSLNPASGVIPGVQGTPMGPGNSVEATFEYVLESRPQAQISVYTAGEPGNTPHTGGEVGQMVQRGKGVVKTRFSVMCDGLNPPPYNIVTIRCRMADVSTSPPTPLVQFNKPVKYRFVCKVPGKAIGAKLEAFPREYKGPCPVKIIFKGLIETDGPATVKYVFDRSDGATDMNDRHFALTVPPFRRAVDWYWQIGGPGMVFDGWEQIRIVTPNAGFKSNEAHFRIVCDGPPVGPFRPR